MNKKEKLAFAFVAALAMSSGGFAFGQSVNNVSSDQVIYACVTGVNGNITKVSNTPKTCPKGTTPISWNMVGPKGEQGLQGIQGLMGEQGPIGPMVEVPKQVELKVVNSQGVEEYPVVNFEGQNLIKLNDFYWALDKDLNLKPVSYATSGTLQLFKTEDCSGDAYISNGWKGNGAIVSNFALGTSTSGNQLGSQAYSVSSVVDSLSEIRSMMTVSSIGQLGICEPTSNLDVIFSDFMKVLQYTEPIAQKRQGYLYRTFRYNMLSCTISIDDFYRNIIGLINADSTYVTLPDCASTVKSGWSNFLLYSLSPSDYSKLPTRLDFIPSSEYTASISSLSLSLNKLHLVQKIDTPAPLVGWTYKLD